MATELFHQQWDAVSGAPVSFRAWQRSGISASGRAANRSDRWDARASASCGTADRSHRWDARTSASRDSANRCDRWGGSTPTAWCVGQQENVPWLWVRSYRSGLLWPADEGGYADAR